MQSEMFGKCPHDCLLLVCQALDRISSLRLARCTRQLYAVANCEGAWRAQPPMEICVRSPLKGGSEVIHLHKRFAGSLLRFLPHFAIIFVEGFGGMDEMAQACVQFPRVRVIREAAQVDHELSFLSDRAWTTLLQAEGLQATLEELHFTSQLPPTIPSLQTCHRLHTLHLRSGLPFLYRAWTHDLPSQLPLRSLTSVRCQDVNAMGAQMPSIMTAVAQCPQLQRLDVHKPRM